MEKPRNIIVRAPNFLGDHVMALPFYARLRAHYPTSRITLLGPGFSDAYVDPALNFSYRPLLGVDGHRLRSGALAAAFKEDGYDLSVSLVASFSSAFLFWRAGIGHRIGFAETLAMPLLTHPTRWKGRAAGLHKTDLYLSLLSEASVPTAREKTEPRPTTANRRIVIAPGASLPLREWPFFVELIGWLRTRFPEFVITIVGGQNEAVWHKRLERLADSQVEDLIEKTDLSALVGVFSSAALVISNDSGPAHVAASVANVPTLVIFGPGDPQYVAPLTENTQVVRRADLACSPCESAICRAVEKKACLNGLGVDAVIGAIEKMAIFH